MKLNENIPVFDLFMHAFAKQRGETYRSDIHQASAEELEKYLAETSVKDPGQLEAFNARLDAMWDRPECRDYVAYMMAINFEQWREYDIAALDDRRELIDHLMDVQVDRYTAEQLKSPPSPKPRGVLYVVEPEDVPHRIKIGRWGGSVSKLGSRYKVYFPRSIKVTVIQCEDPKASEALLHQMFRQHSVGGEWYDAVHLASFLKGLKDIGDGSVTVRHF